MLFWLQSSLNTASKQIAVKAATNNKFSPDDVENRCNQAAEDVNAIPPGYNKQVRQNFIDAIKGGQTKIADFDEIEEGRKGLNARKKLEELGVKIP